MSTVHPSIPASYNHAPVLARIATGGDRPGTAIARDGSGDTHVLGGNASPRTALLTPTCSSASRPPGTARTALAGDGSVDIHVPLVITLAGDGSANTHAGWLGRP